MNLNKMATKESRVTFSKTFFTQFFGENVFSNKIVLISVRVFTQTPGKNFTNV